MVFLLYVTEEIEPHISALVLPFYTTKEEMVLNRVEILYNKNCQISCRLITID